MRDRRAATCAFFFGMCAVAVSARGEAAAKAPAPVVRACANDRLPREILDGPTRERTMPLRTIEVAAPTSTLRLAIADDERDREFGLMCVTRLRAKTGMIFVFGAENSWEFWMKNTLVPLDMIWVTAAGEVTTVAPNVPAVTRTTPESALPRRNGRGTYVIELGANEAAAAGIVVGTYLALPKLRAR